MANPSIEALRSQFRITDRYSYLNNAGIAPLCRPAEDGIKEFVEEAATHGAARYKVIFDRCESVRDSFAKLIHASPAEVAFVANTSDGISLVANGIDWKPGDRVVIPDHEFPANVYPWLALERFGVKVDRVPFVEGRCPPEAIIAKLPGARLLSVSAVSYATGYRFDLETLGRACQQNGVLFCVDGIQALGALPIDVASMHIDFLSADGHKWLVGPEGAGCFYASRKRFHELRPSKVGWRNVRGDLNFGVIDFTFKDTAGRYEEGTPNVPGLFGLAGALRLLLDTGAAQIEEQIKTLTDYLCEALPKIGYQVRSPRQAKEWSGIVSFQGDDHDAKRMGLALERGIVIAHRDGALRASPHAYNNLADLDRLLEVLAEIRPGSSF